MKIVPTVYELRKKGWKVKVGHYRNLHKFNPKTGQRTGKYHVLISEYRKDTEGFFINSYGGKTTVYIKTPENDSEYLGECVCSPNERYVKSYGLKKALARALAEIKNQG